MLPAAARLRRREEFAEVVRRGRRTARGPLVLHALVSLGAPSPPRAGFVIGKVVGPAVVRNRLRRRLRHLLRTRLVSQPSGLLLVVRAQAGAGALSSAELGLLLDSALPAVVAP